MPALPTLKCPRCRGASEYHATIEMLDPPVGKIDIGYCAACRCLFEHVRDTATAYESTSWSPVCRRCHQPVSPFAVEGSDEDQRFRFACREHHDESWEWHRGADQWARL